jgi:peptidoglycan/xylan/chitin deacetylase (PgdA/CDA1 family)
MSDTGEPIGGSIKLSSDRTETNYFVVYYGGAFKLRYKPGWNLVNLRTSDWKAIGSPTWSNIQLMRIRIYSSTANSFSFDGLTSGVVARPAVIFAFDNGLTSLYSQAYAYMQPRNVRGTAYIPTNLVGTTGKSTWVQLLEMYNGGWTIGNYTMTGSNLAGLSQAGQESQLSGARTELHAHGINNSDYVAYPGGSYDNNTLSAMSTLAMRSGRTRLSFNNVPPMTNPYEIAQRSITLSTSITTSMNWVTTAISRQEIIVITFQDITPTPTANDWYTSRFKSLVDYCISQGIPIITMDDLYRLQSGSINIPLPVIP